MNKSESIGALAAALSQLQGEVENLHKDKQGYGYKYAELSSVLDEAKPLLAKYKLAVAQLTVNDPSNASVVGVETVLMHCSGEWISSTVYMPVEVKKGVLAQAAGSVITYARRYALAAMLGIAQTDNDASVKEIEPHNEMISADLMCKLRNLIEDKQLENKIVTWKAHFKVDDLEDLSITQMKQLIIRIEEAN
jgi:hypothetical protein